jgi:xylulokinase
LEKPVCASRVKEQACLGSCILAAAGTGILPSLEAGCERFVTMDDRTFLPDEKNTAIYREGYEKYKELYKRVQDLM